MTLDYQALFAHAADGIVVLDATLVVIDANAAFATVIGLPIERIVERSITEFIQREDLRLHPPQLEAIQQKGSAITMRIFGRPDGAVVHAEVAASQLPGDRLLLVIRDVRRRPAISALRDSEARFRGVAENLNAGLVMTDLDNRAIYVNGRMCEMTGYSRWELEGKVIGSVLLGDVDRDAEGARLRRRAQGMREQYELMHRRRDGTSFMTEVSASPLHDGTGRIVGTVGVVIDVSQRYEAEREMARREQRYRLMFEVMPMPAWVYDIESYRILAVNPAALAHYGYSEREFLAMTILDVRPPEDVERVKAQVQARRNGFEGQGRGWGYRHRKADGTLIDVEVISHAFDFEGHSARIVLINDVTEQTRLRTREREMEQQLLQAQKMEAVGRLAGGVAHDFNNLLTVVLSATSALADSLPGSSPLQDEVRDIRHAVERGSALTRQLLAFGRKELHAPARLDAHTVVVNVERLLSRALGGGVRLEIRRGPGDMHVMVDASQLEQVLVNLAINARDAMPRGGRLVIATGVRALDAAAGASLELPAGDYVAIEVVDSGVGMDETTRARAFEPFYTTKGPLEGTGLGLSTVYGIVRQSGGAVTLASAPGQGTTVTILLPLCTEAGGALPALHTVERGRVPTPTPGCVLLVEDEMQVRVQGRRLLERCGFTVLEATNGEEALRVFEMHRDDIDVVVTDVMMPVLGGVEMVARIRLLAPEVPVVFVSGFTAEDRGLPLDAQTVFVAKPYTLTALCDAIDGVVAAAA